MQTLAAKIAVLCVILSATETAVADGRSFDGTSPLVFDSFLLAESPLIEGSRLGIDAKTPGIKIYSGGHLPSDLDVEPKMYTFKSFFTVDQALSTESLSLYMGMSEYPYRIYLNGSEIFSKGRYKDGHYNSSIRSSYAVFLPNSMLHFGQTPNELAIEAYPHFEVWGLDTVYIDRTEAVVKSVFQRNFVALDLVKGAFVLALIIGLYFVALFAAERRKQLKYLIFAMICFSFCLSYYNVATHIDLNNEARLEALSKGGMVLISSFMLAFCCEFTSIFNTKRIFPIVSTAIGGATAIFIMTQPSKEAVLNVFGYSMNFIIVPQILLDIGILAYALVKRKNLFVIPLLAAFVVVIFTAISDVLYMNAAMIPYAWLTAYGYVAIVLAIFGTLAMEQARLYQISVQQTADLIVNQSRIEALNLELVKQKDSFFRFVPTQFLELLGRDSAVDICLGDSSLRYLSILFSDIRQFAALSEGMLPGENFEFLNSYLFRMEKAIQRNGGFVDKYIGDAIMALFASENNERHAQGKSATADTALIAAIEMRRELDDFNHYLSTHGAPPVEIGIGVNTGEVMLGTVGSESRLDTTVIGDSVNLSSRLENLTKFYKTSTLLSEQTVNAVMSPGDYTIRLVDHVSVPGRTMPLMIYELLDPESERDDPKLTYKDSFDAAMSLYLSRHFDEAGYAFKGMRETNRHDYLPKLFADRCAAYSSIPPADDWDGVFRITKKDYES